MLKRGPAAPYWGPAHRRAVDIAIETRDHAGVLARLEAIKTADPIPPSAAGERAYLRGRAAYDAGKLADAEGELVLISKKSRLYSSAVYLRGVIRARQGRVQGSAEAMCEIAATEDNDKFTFVVDERYFTIKDLARLGLGRLAHEQGEYDDAYYHYFQIPDDSAYLPDALFEASWSMYQKRELATSRDLVHEFLKTFPTSPLWPEASLLAGYVELADCKFDDSQKWYDTLVARLQPIVDEIDKVRKDPELRKQLFANGDHALPRGQADRRGRRHQARQGSREDADRRRARPAPPRSEVHPPERRDHRHARAREQRAAGRRGSGRTSAHRSARRTSARSRPRRRSSRSSSPTPTRSSRICAGSPRRSPISAPRLARAKREGHDAGRTPPPRKPSASTRCSTKVQAAARPARSPPPTRPRSAVGRRPPPASGR